MALTRNLLTALLAAMASATPGHAAALQLDCTYKTEMGSVQPDGSMFRKERDIFSLNSESRNGSLTDRNGTIYDVKIRFTADKIIALRTEALGPDTEHPTNFIYRWDISRTDGSMLKFTKFVITIAGETEATKPWRDNPEKGSCQKKAIKTMF